MIDFTPKGDWQWVFDTDSKQIAVTMGGVQIALAFKERMLVLTHDFPLYFTLEDVINYNELLETLPLASFSESQSNKIILHVLAIGLFHKPIMPQCWLFEAENALLDDLKEGHIYSLKSKKMDSRANYLLVEVTNEYALCMLLDENHDLSERKLFKQFHVVKISTDLLQPMWHEGQNNWRSYQIG